MQDALRATKAVPRFHAATSVQALPATYRFITSKTVRSSDTMCGSRNAHAEGICTGAHPPARLILSLVIW